ncbi:Fc.00g095960.m01.CDS01 [Cosmosporella sp. VM-42]
MTSQPPPPVYEPEDPNTISRVVTSDTPNGVLLSSPPMVHTNSFQGPPTPQAGYPPQEPGMPLGTLQSQSGPVVCPKCGIRSMTSVTSESGGCTHAVAAVVCLFSCLGCIPYCITSLKDIHHRCGRCAAPLATFHRSGRTEVICHAK